MTYTVHDHYIYTRTQDSWKVFARLSNRKLEFFLTVDIARYKKLKLSLHFFANTLNLCTL